MKSPTMNHVRIYDSKTGEIVTIPAPELAPGMIRANIEGIGEVFVPADTRWLSTEPPRPLPDGFTAMATAVFGIIGPQFRSLDLRGWIDGFGRDAHPVRDLTLWMTAASVFYEMTHQGKDPAEVRNDVFHLCASVITNGEHALETVMLYRLSKARAQAVVNRCLRIGETEWLAFWDGRIDLERWFELRSAEG